jgi:hypothetical protein
MLSPANRCRNYCSLSGAIPANRFCLITHDIEEAVFLASELLLLSPGPGQVVERLALNFGQRYANGEPCRSIKSDPEFIAQREYVLGKVFQQREVLDMSLHSAALKEVATAEGCRFAVAFACRAMFWLSIATLAGVIAGYLVGQSLRCISSARYFCPRRSRCCISCITIASPQGFMDATLWQHLAASLTRIVIALLAAVILGVPVGYRHGIE